MARHGAGAFFHCCGQVYCFLGEMHTAHLASQPSRYGSRCKWWADDSLAADRSRVAAVSPRGHQITLKSAAVAGPGLLDLSPIEQYFAPVPPALAQKLAVM